jgi:DNA-binding NarL/FixJ family response regulator
VDDNREFLASATRLLKGQGVDVIGVAASGAAVARLAEELQPDVVLVDVELGGESGFAVAAALVPTRVILISTYAEDELVELVAASAAIGFIPKSDLSANAIESLLG